MPFSNHAYSHICCEVFLSFEFGVFCWCWFLISLHAYIQRPLRANDPSWKHKCWRISIRVLHQHMKQPAKIQGLLHVETWHNKQQWKQQKHSPFQMWKRQLVQYNFERIQSTIDTPWKIWSMSIHPEEFCSNMIASRGCFFFLSQFSLFLVLSGIYLLLFITSSNQNHIFETSQLFLQQLSMLRAKLVAVGKSSARELCIVSKMFLYKLL